MPKYDVDIRGSKFEIDAPDDAHAQAAVEELSKQPQHFELGQAPGDNPANLPAGFDPATGNVEHASLGDKGSAFTGSVLEGVPIAGPALRSGAESVAAQLAGVDKSQVTANANRQMADNPNTALAGNVVGATAGTLPLMAAAPEAFGLGGGGMMAKSLASAASGAGLGGADSAVRSGGDPVETAKGAAMGGGLGLLGPAAGRLVGKGVGAVRDSFTTSNAAKAAGMPKATFQRITRAMNADGLTEAVARQRMGELGPNAMIMDMGPNLQRQAGALAAIPGRNQEIVRSAVASRQAGSSGRITDALNKVLDKPVDSYQVSDNWVKIRANAAKPAYEEAYSAGDTAIWSPELERLSSSPTIQNAMRGAVNVWRDRSIADGFGSMNPGALVDRGGQLSFLSGKVPVFPNLQFWDYTKRILDDKIRVAIRAGQTQKAATFTALAHNLRTDLDSAVPAYKAARDAYAGPSAILDALEEGGSAFSSKVTPGELRAKLAEMTAGEREAYIQGARAQIAHTMGTARNDALSARSTFQKGYNKEKLDLLVGPEKAAEMLKSLDAETAFTKTRDTVTGNSETAARAAATAELGVPAFGAREGYMAGGAMGAMRSAMVRALEGGVNSMRSGANEAANEQLARHLASPNVDAVARGLGKLGGAKPNDIAIRRAVQAALLAPAIGGHNR